MEHSSPNWLLIERIINMSAKVITMEFLSGTAWACTFRVKVNGANHSVISRDPVTNRLLGKCDLNTPWLLAYLHKQIG